MSATCSGRISVTLCELYLKIGCVTTLAFPTFDSVVRVAWGVWIRKEGRSLKLGHCATLPLIHLSGRVAWWHGTGPVLQGPLLHSSHPLKKHVPELLCRDAHSWPRYNNYRWGFRCICTIVLCIILRNTQRFFFLERHVVVGCATKTPAGYFPVATWLSHHGV